MRRPGTCCSLVTHSPDKVDKTPRPCAAPSQVTCLAGELTRRSASQRLIAPVWRCVGGPTVPKRCLARYLRLYARTTKTASVQVLHVQYTHCVVQGDRGQGGDPSRYPSARFGLATWTSRDAVLCRRFVRDTEPPSPPAIVLTSAVPWSSTSESFLTFPRCDLAIALARVRRV
jgi:hypothetical protein